MRTSGLVALVALAAAATAAHADDSYDALAAKAQAMTDRDLAGAVWALTATCDQGGAAGRLCRFVRDQRAAQLRTTTWRVDAEAGAFAVSEWDPAARAVLTSLSGCVACAKPIGGLYLVSHKAAPTFVGEVARAATLHEGARGFPTQAAAERWRAQAATARAQFVVRLAGPAGGKFERDGKRGLALEVLAYRVHTPCDGAIVVAQPRADALAAEPAACAAIVDDTPPPVDPTAGLPEALTADDLKRVLRPVSEAARDCFDAYGVPGKGKLTYTVSGAGAITAYEQVGDFVDTPTGRCIDKAAKAVSFPASRKASFTFTYPISVQ
jgi:hypothetical protein